MGNYKFRFSDMIPNAWFYKPKNMNNYTKTLSHSKQKHSLEFTNSNQRKSYYFTRDLTLAHPSRRPTPPCQFSTPIPAGCSCVATAADNPSECTNSGPDQSSLSEPDFVLTEYGSDRSWDPLLSNLTQPGTTGAAMQNCAREDPHRSYRETGKTDIVTDTGKSDDQCRRLPPIITRRRLPSAGIKLRVNSSPRRRSMAVVKASKNPRRDFRESMVEMISQYNIRESNDLEELLACYLLLNSDDHHHLIINVFKQIWFDFIHLRLE